jgi:hypothetical protein
MARETKPNLVQLRMSDAQAHAIDVWRKKQIDPPTRSEAIRRLLEKELSRIGRRAQAAEYPGKAGLLARMRRSQEFHDRVAPLIVELRSRGLELKEVAAELNRRGLHARRGGPWAPNQVHKVLARYRRTGTGEAS